VFHQSSTKQSQNYNQKALTGTPPIPDHNGSLKTVSHYPKNKTNDTPSFTEIHSPRMATTISAQASHPPEYGKIISLGSYLGPVPIQPFFYSNL
jgi:hypothetical protein